MDHQLQALTQLATMVQQRPPVDGLLRIVVDCSAAILGADHASVRLLDSTGSHLVAACRSGDESGYPNFAFERGEGLLGWIAERGESLLLEDPMSDPRFARRPGTRRLAGFVGAPLSTGRQTFGVLSAVSHSRGFTRDELAYLQLIAAICAPQLEIARLSHLTQVDPLTGSLNRRGFDRVYGDLEGFGAEEALSVVLVDIDHFKSVNDNHGHAVGDEVLRQVARRLSEVVRAGDQVVRLGGEEFLMVLPGVALEGAEAAAERARREVEASVMEVGAELIRVTISAGVAERHAGESRDELVRRADHAMYVAKESGRNRVVCAGR